MNDYLYSEMAEAIEAAETERKLEEALERIAELENRQLADFAVLVALVPHGYEAHFVISGEVVEVQCRDFGGSYQVEQIASHLHAKLSELFPSVAEPVLH